MLRAKRATFTFRVTTFGISNELLSTRNVNVARFARNDEYDFFCDFQTLCDLFLQHQIVIFICISVGKWPMLRNAKE